MSSAAPNSQTSTKSPKKLGHLDLLLALILLQVSQSFLSGDSIIKRSIFNLLFLAIVVSAIRSLSKSRIRMVAAVTVGIIAFAVASYAEIHHSITLVVANYSCYVIVFTLLILALCESVFGDGPVNVNRIVGAANIYVILGLLFALVFALLEAVQPGSFDLTSIPSGVGIHQNVVSELIYFSNVTLTTLGYGEILPISNLAKTLATIEATIGQLFLAIVMARLVGLHIAQSG